MPLVLAGATSGQATVQATDAATVTLTLPASSGTLVVTGGAQTIEFADGSAAAPSITNSGDTNTGIFFPAADTIAFTEGGAESIRINSSGNFLIGYTADQGSGKLQVNGAGRIGNFDFNTDDITYVGGGNFQIGTVFGVPMLFKTSNTERMRIDSSGNLLVGKTSSQTTSKIETIATPGVTSGIGVYATSTSNSNVMVFLNANGQVGSIVTSGSSTAYNTSSDYRLKENIAPMTGALATVQALKPVTYKWKVDGSSGQGFIAHELQAVVPDCVTGEKDGMRTEQYEVSPAIPATHDEEGNELTPAVEAVMGEREVPDYQGIDTSFLVATLTAAIQEQQAIITDLKARIETLENT